MTIQEIREQIRVIDNQISILEAKKYEYESELKDTIRASFEAEHMVKPGDLITTRQGEKMYYGGFIFDAYNRIVCLCHSAKKDGTASKAVRHMEWSDF